MGTLLTDLARGRSVVETHISWVFIDDRDVYKMKKPVNFGFLDFTTLERRLAACQAEVTLNSRFTRDVYLGVKPITCDSSGRYRIDGEGSLVDYCVHMRRLSEDDRLDRLLERGAVTPRLLRHLAHHIARFHAATPTNATIAQFGEVDVIRQNVTENFAQTRAHIGEFITNEQAVRLERAQLSFLDGSAPLFARRIQHARVRDGHGDLRLEHVYHRQEEFQVLDCIEFNDRFRYADVCADLAFLSMDLRHNDRPDLAELLLANYAVETSDFELYALVDFYESYRAMVRAKIHSFVAEDLQCSSAERTTAHREAERYFLQALKASLSRPAGLVIAVGGLIASGKSHTCSLLSDLLAVPVISSDRVRKHLLRVDRYTSLNEGQFSGAYAEEVTLKTYETVREWAGFVVQSGRTVVLDASFRSQRERAALCDWCRQLGARLLFVECVAPPDTLRTRLRERAQGPSVSDAREELLDAFLRDYQPPRELAPELRCTLDTTLPVVEQSRILQTFIAQLS